MQQNTKASTKMQSSAKIASKHIKKATVRREQRDKRIRYRGPDAATQLNRTDYRRAKATREKHRAPYRR